MLYDVTVNATAVLFDFTFRWGFLTEHLRIKQKLLVKYVSHHNAVGDQIPV